jgi:hypothetical protein
MKPEERENPLFLMQCLEYYIERTSDDSSSNNGIRVNLVYPWAKRDL